jgi:hypothetical protein
MNSESDNKRAEVKQTERRNTGSAGVPPAVSAKQTRPRRLLLCLDGVPYELILAARHRGLFDKFGAPTRLLSPFPTLTNIGLTAMLGATPPPGYEGLYFDRNERELRGGVRKYIGRRTPDKRPSSYMDELDYQEPLMFEFLIYVATEKIWRADMQGFRERFALTPQTRDFFGFIKATDGLLHIGGPQKLQVALESLDQILREIQAYCGSDTEIVLFSDHGMNLEENRRSHLLTHLRGRGFSISGDLRHELRNGIAIPAWGLCGYAALYCADQDFVPGVASAVAELEGVDFTLWREGDAAVIVQGMNGTARIERNETNGDTRYRYAAAEGDPLQLAPILRGLGEAGELDEAGYASDRAWLGRTAHHVYPDAVANLFTSLHTQRVRYNADVLVSFRDGYYFGWSPFEYVVSIAATHGNALSASSTAFLMSTHRTFPEYVRADDAQPLLRA